MHKWKMFKASAVRSLLAESAHSTRMHMSGATITGPDRIIAEMDSCPLAIRTYQMGFETRLWLPVSSILLLDDKE